jgi:hypothetical protein
MQFIISAFTHVIQILSTLLKISFLTSDRQFQKLDAVIINTITCKCAHLFQLLFFFTLSELC